MGKGAKASETDLDTKQYPYTVSNLLLGQRCSQENKEEEYFFTCNLRTKHQILNPNNWITLKLEGKQSYLVFGILLCIIPSYAVPVAESVSWFP